MTEIEKLIEQRDEAVAMLADWCAAVQRNGTGWDDWDEYYKDASFRPCGIRDLLDEAIKLSLKKYGDYEEGCEP